MRGEQKCACVLDWQGQIWVRCFRVETAEGTDSWRETWAPLRGKLTPSRPDEAAWVRQFLLFKQPDRDAKSHTDIQENGSLTWRGHHVPVCPFSSTQGRGEHLLPLCSRVVTEVQSVAGRITWEGVPRRVLLPSTNVQSDRHYLCDLDRGLPLSYCFVWPAS